MGCGASKSVNNDEANLISRSIEKQIEADRQAQKRTIKLLLLGTGESGKSTVLKQMRLRYAEAYTLNERLDYIPVILSNLVLSMNVVIEAMETLSIPFPDEHAESSAAEIAQLPQLVDNLTPSQFQAVEHLWATPQIKHCVSRSVEYQLNDSAAYFFENAPRFAQDGFLPNDEDILRSRIKTTGISESVFNVGDRIWKVCDIGGQRSERRKWVSCFEGVNVLLFLVAVSELDQRLYEDSEVRRFAEAENLFGQIANSPWFKQSQLILFLNKIDLLTAKLPTMNMIEHLPGYTGPKEVPAILSYLGQRLTAQSKSGKRIYVHSTCCTDTKAIRIILNAVQDQIAQNLLTSAYLI